MLADIATLTGGQVISEEVGLKLENVDPQPARPGPPSVVVTKDETTIIEGQGSEDEIKARITQIRTRSTTPTPTTTARSSRSGWPSWPVAWA